MTDVLTKESDEMSPTFLVQQPTVTLAFVFMINDVILFRPIPPWDKDREEDRLEVLYYLRKKVKAESISQEVDRISNLFGAVPLLAFSNSHFNEDEEDDFLDQTIGFTLGIKDNLVQLDIAPEIAAAKMSECVTTALARHQPIEILTPVGVSMISLQAIYIASKLPQTVVIYPSGAKPQLSQKRRPGGTEYEATFLAD